MLLALSYGHMSSAGTPSACTLALCLAHVCLLWGSWCCFARHMHSTAAIPVQQVFVLTKRPFSGYAVKVKVSEIQNNTAHATNIAATLHLKNQLHNAHVLAKNMQAFTQDSCPPTVHVSARQHQQPWCTCVQQHKWGSGIYLHENIMRASYRWKQHFKFKSYCT